ncbi:MAG: endo-1,4-beta-xylanase [Silvibacterium sp.]
MRLDRRGFLAASAAAGVGFAATRYGIGQTADAQLPRLKDVARAAGLMYGSDSDSTIVEQPTEYQALFAAQCALYAANFDWSRSNPKSQDVHVWEDPNIGFARAHGMKLTGGHLVWHTTTPAWLNDMPAKTAEAAIVKHVADLGARYGDILYSWNVANETIAPEDKRLDGYRKTIYLEKFGLDYFDFTAHAAQEAAPGALRVYNDYGFAMGTWGDTWRRVTLLRLLDAFKKRGTPIQAVGLQSHLRLDGSKFDANAYREFLREISDRGFLILITELDVFDVKTPAAVAVRDQMVADLYSQLLNTALENKAVKAVVTWGLSDRYSWLNSPYFPQFARSDGLPRRPLPFDRDFHAKPAFTALLKALQNAPYRVPA